MYDQDLFRILNEFIFKDSTTQSQFAEDVLHNSGAGNFRLNGTDLSKNANYSYRSGTSLGSYESDEDTK